MPKYTFKVEKRADGDWGWSLWEENNRQIGASGEGYKNKRHAVEMCEKIKKEVHRAPIKIADD